METSQWSIALRTPWRDTVEGPIYDKLNSRVDVGCQEPVMQFSQMSTRKLWFNKREGSIHDKSKSRLEVWCQGSHIDLKMLE